MQYKLGHHIIAENEKQIVCSWKYPEEYALYNLCHQYFRRKERSLYWNWHKTRLLQSWIWAADAADRV